MLAGAGHDPGLGGQEVRGGEACRVRDGVHAAAVASPQSFGDLDGVLRASQRDRVSCEDLFDDEPDHAVDVGGIEVDLADLA